MQRRLGLGLAMGICAAWLATACGASSGGGGGGIAATGGAAGTFCNTKYSSQGCLGLKRTECVALPASATPDAGEWTDLGSCTNSQYCAQEVSPADPSKKIAVCKDVQSPVADTVSGGDGTSSGGDGTTGGDAKEPTVAEMKACVLSKCGTEWSACKADTAGCAMMANCVEKCTDKACADACPNPPDNNSQALAVAMCMMSKGCVPTEPAKPVCGDGKCETGETTASCAKDCPSTGPKCGDGKCEGTENVEMCPQDCKATGPVCGNGKCESGETPASCKQDCPGTTTGKCGDAKCDSGEATTCPMDCASQYNATFQCGISKCGSQWTACLNDAKCKGMFNCAVMCDCNESCIQECATGMETNAAVIGMVTCSSNAQCPNPCPTSGPVCGNGKCESGETKASCSKDCGAAGPVCGNGTCETGESKASCAQDCGTTTTGHPCDASCGGQAPSGCYCDAECMKAGDCCDATGQPAGNSCTGSTCGTCQAP